MPNTATTTTSSALAQLAHLVAMARANRVRREAAAQVKAKAGG
jgi:hypothetical protein